MKPIIYLLMITLNIVGCGLKGPLYFPEEENKELKTERAVNMPSNVEEK